MGSQGVTRLRPLTAAQQQRLYALRQAARLLDSAFQVPGTSRRIGLDPVLGLVPVVGDLLSPLFALAILWQARDIGVPRVVQLRMVCNVAIDGLLGVVPVVGDLFDFVWKANDRNLALLDRHAHEEHGPRTGDWVFVLTMMALTIAVAALPFVVLATIIATVRGLLGW